MKSNCLVFAVSLLARRWMKGDFSVSLKYRPTRLFKFRWAKWLIPHFLVVRKYKTGNTRLVSYKPKDPVRRLCPPIVFEGVVCYGD